jgi:hypothetical protein
MAALGMTISDKPAASIAFLFVPGKSAKRDRRLGRGRLSPSPGSHFQEKVPIFRRPRLVAEPSVKDRAKRRAIGSLGARVVDDIRAAYSFHVAPTGQER